MLELSTWEVNVWQPAERVAMIPPKADIVVALAVHTLSQKQYLYYINICDGYLDLGLLWYQLGSFFSASKTSGKDGGDFIVT